jgi:N-acetylglucosaminylphosphatidylinositol deacetylase
MTLNLLIFAATVPVAYFALWHILLISYKKPSICTKKTLLVIAHPDDECLFFAPTLLNLKNVHVTCLSTGNTEGLGKVRSKEIKESCKVFSIAPDNVHQVDDELLRDSMEIVWDNDAVLNQVVPMIKQLEIEQVSNYLNQDSNIR